MMSSRSLIALFVCVICSAWISGGGVASAVIATDDGGKTLSPSSPNDQLLEFRLQAATVPASSPVGSSCAPLTGEKRGEGRSDRLPILAVEERKLSRRYPTPEHFEIIIMMWIVILVIIVGLVGILAIHYSCLRLALLSISREIGGRVRGTPTTRAPVPDPGQNKPHHPAVDDGDHEFGVIIPAVL